jgi:hypothetical protein
MLSLKFFTIFAIFGLALAQGPAPSTELPEKIPGTTAGLSGGWSKVQNNDDIKGLMNGSIQTAVGQGLFDSAEKAIPQCAFTQVVAGTNALIILASADGQAASVSAFQPLPGQNSPDTFTAEAITPADANAICAEGPTSNTLPPTLSATAPGGWTKLFASDPEVQTMLTKINSVSGTEVISNDNDTVLCASSQIVAGKQWFFSIDIDNNPDFADEAILVWVVEPVTGDPEITILQVTKGEAQEACASATPPPKSDPFPLLGGAPTGSGRTAALVGPPLVLAVAAMIF